MASFGSHLRRERELRGIDLREIADATKISLRFLQALEDDRVDVLPTGIFRRCFVREYARHLGLDADRTVAEFLYAHGDRHDAPPAAEPGAAGAVTAATAGFYRRAKPLSVAVFALVAGLLAWRSMGVAPPPAPAPAPASIPGPPVLFPEDRIYPIAPQPIASQPAVVEKSSRLVVTLRATEDCWVGAEVDGQARLNRTLAGGEVETLEADAKIVLSVGNAGALAMRINDRPGVALGALGEVRRDIVISRESLPALVEDDASVRTSDSG